MAPVSFTMPSSGWNTNVQFQRADGGGLKKVKGMQIKDHACAVFLWWFYFFVFNTETTPQVFPGQCMGLE